MDISKCTTLDLIAAESALRDDRRGDVLVTFLVEITVEKILHGGVIAQKTLHWGW